MYYEDAEGMRLPASVEAWDELFDEYDDYPSEEDDDL